MSPGPPLDILRYTFASLVTITFAYGMQSGPIELRKLKVFAYRPLRWDDRYDMVPPPYSCCSSRTQVYSGLHGGHVRPYVRHLRFDRRGARGNYGRGA
jgi:hypothetical protein